MTGMKLLIAGIGYVGKALAGKVSGQGWQVWGLRRKPEPVQGVTMIAVDMLDPKSLVNLPQVDCVVLAQSPSQKTDSYEKTYLQATQNLLAALKDQKLKKLILISSSGVYGEQSGEWVDENTPPRPKDENGRILLKAEEAVLKSGQPAIVLRLSGIYGPGRNRILSIKEGRVKPVLSGAFMNRIHVDDAVSAIALLLEKGAPGEIYLASDDNPCTEREFYEWLKLEGPIKDEELRGKRCANRKLKSIGWKLSYPSYLQGYTALL
jgi:nucleoside-diphosphate-sugar epimerase